MKFDNFSRIKIIDFGSSTNLIKDVRPELS